MKKLISVFLAALMMLALAAPAFAADSEKALKSAMTVVKQRVEIGEEYTEFDYYANDNYFGKTNFSMTWSTEDYSKYISATVCGKIITNYSIQRDYSYGDARLGTKTKAELLKSAKAFIKKINPSVANRLIIDKDSFNASVFNQYATISFDRVANGIPVASNGGSLSIDKDTGEVISFRLSWTQGSGFAKPDKAISSDKAMSQISKLYELKPVYTMEYDWETDTRTVRLIYNNTKNGDIDAFTGKISTFEESYQEYDNEDDALKEESTNSAADMESPEAGGVTFNEKELEAIEQNEKLLNEEQVIKILTDDKYINLTPDYYLSNSSLYQDSYDKDKFTYNLYFNKETEDDYKYDYIGVEMNAETGEIYSFWQSVEDGWTTSFDNAKSDAIAEDVIKTYLGDKSGEYVLTFSEENHYYDNNEGITGKDYHYVRVVNGVETDFDSVNIYVNHDYTISSFSYGYTDIEFPSAEMLTPTQAFEQLFTQVQPTLTYKINVNDKTKVVKSALVYEMPYFTLDAKTGELYEKYYRWYNNEETEVREYTDLKGSIKTIAERLAEYGIVLMDEDGKLNADKAITIDEFAALTSYIGQGSISYPVYPYAIEDVAIMEDAAVTEGTNPDTSSPQFITREQAAAAIVSSIYGTSVAEIKGIFKSPYSDVSEDSDYVGYIAIAAAQGIMTGKSNKFNPTDTLTRGDALRIIYTYLTK